MAWVLNKFERKPILEKEIKNGLQVQEELKAKEEAVFADKSKVEDMIKAMNETLREDKAKADETLKPLQEALAKAKKEIDDAEAKAKQEIAAAEKKLEDIDQDHEASIETTKQSENYRSDETLTKLARELEETNASMRALRGFVIDDKKDEEEE